MSVESNRAFGQLRALFAKSELDYDHAEEFWGLIEHTSHEHASVYREVWVPYLRDLIRKTPRMLIRWTTLEKLQHAWSILPVPCFGLLLRQWHVKQLHALAHDPCAQGVVSLHLAQLKLNVDDARLLAKSKHFTALQHLMLDSSLRLGPGLSVLANSSFFEHLVSLSMPLNMLTDKECVDLVTSERVGTLRSLNLRSNRIGARGASALAASSSLHALSALDLSVNPIGDEGAVALSRAVHQLTSLKLLGCDIGPRGARALAQAPTLRGLVTLKLSLEEVRPEGREALASSPYLSEKVRAQFR